MNSARTQRRRLAFHIYYYGVIAVAVALTAFLALNFRPDLSRWPSWLLFFGVVLFTDSRFSIHQIRDGGNLLASRTLASSMLVLFGPLVAIAMDLGSSLFRGLVQKSTTKNKMFFNMAMLTIVNGVAGLVYMHLPFNDRFSTPLFLIPLIVMLWAYSITNSVIVSGIMSLDRGIPLREIWHRDVSRSALASGMELPFTAIIILLYLQAGPWTLAIYVPIIWIYFALNNARMQQREAHMASIAVLATTLEADEPYTHGHSYRVSQYAITIGRAMGMSPGELETLEYGGLLHDIGKIAITNDIICKPGRLTDDEFSVLAEHPAIGARIVEQIKFMPDTVDLVRHHHERPDGKGYPDGLKGDEISLGSGILNVCDAFDAMTSDRSYRAALPVEKAFEELRKYQGTQFNAAVVDTVVELHRRGEFDVIPDSAVEQVIRQIQRVGEPARAREPEKTEEIEVHEVQ